ncbi:MAG: hypothetical protein KDK27_15675, partial [Leptospiraceae bacterium]|nr:hypothetical protein [Leptospiraceae bacterium]
GKRLSNHSRSKVSRWLDTTILEFEEQNLEGFIQLANHCAREAFGNFPLLTLDAIDSISGNHCARIPTGESIADGMGWKIKIESRDEGPAEVVHVEEWTAIAVHPAGNLRIVHEASSGALPRTWMEKGAPGAK